MQRIPDDSSIFTAEAKAVDLALDFISTCDANNNFIIFSDSLSVLKALNHTSSKNPQIQNFFEKCHELLANKESVLCTIKSLSYSTGSGSHHRCFNLFNLQKRAYFTEKF